MRLLVLLFTLVQAASSQSICKTRVDTQMEFYEPYLYTSYFVAYVDNAVSCAGRVGSFRIYSVAPGNIWVAVLRQQADKRWKLVGNQMVAISSPQTGWNTYPALTTINVEKGDIFATGQDSTQLQFGKPNGAVVPYIDKAMVPGDQENSLSLVYVVPQSMPDILTLLEAGYDFELAYPIQQRSRRFPAVQLDIVDREVLVTTVPTPAPTLGTTQVIPDVVADGSPTNQNCRLGLNTGTNCPAKPQQLRWFMMFNSIAQQWQCVPFLWTGCGGNDNRFVTKDNCQEVCYAT